MNSETPAPSFSGLRRVLALAVLAAGAPGLTSCVVYDGYAGVGYTEFAVPAPTVVVQRSYPQPYYSRPRYYSAPAPRYYSAPRYYPAPRPYPHPGRYSSRACY